MYSVPALDGQGLCHSIEVIDKHVLSNGHVVPAYKPLNSVGR
jgi:hypothetical protein